MKPEKRQQVPVHRGKNVPASFIPAENVVDLRLPETPPPEPPKFVTAARKFKPRPLNKSAKFFALALLLVLPVIGITAWQHAASLKGRVLGESTNAFDSLIGAGKALQGFNTELAQNEFAKAAGTFRSARASVDRFGVLVNAASSIIPAASQAKSGKALLVAGEQIAIAGGYLAKIVEPLQLPKEERTADVPQLLTSVQENLAPALTALERALVALQTVKVRDVPEAQRASLQALHQALPELQAALTQTREASLFLLDLLGGKRTQRYLVLFQNTLELRATGGFLGSLALIDVSNGNITKLEVPGGGTYDFQGQLKEKVIAPAPLHLVNPHWQMQDANWWPDFPTSAEKLMWFYEKSGGPTVDGVIAITPAVVIDLLRLTGPIELPAPYSVTITADNFLHETLSAVQQNEDRPKQIIADLLPRILDQVFLTPSVDQLSTLATFEQAMSTKDILFYFPDKEREQRVKDLGWAGEIKAAPKDYLHVNDTNIGGGKTDGVIDETIAHDARIADDGTITDTVTITRVHHGVPNDPLSGVRNVDYVRVYVPKGSTLVSVDGFERIDPKRFQLPDPGYHTDDFLLAVEGRSIVDELTGTSISEQFGKTVFANWLGVGPGETVKATITYTLPFRLNVKRTLFRQSNDEYSLFIQQQPGAATRFLVQTLTYPATYAVAWKASQEGEQTAEGNTLQYMLPLDRDRAFGVLFRPSR